MRTTTHQTVRTGRPYEAAAHRAPRFPRLADTRSFAALVLLGCVCAPWGCTSGGGSGDAGPIAFLSAPLVVSPTGGAVGLRRQPALRWEDARPVAPNAVYDVQLATSASFATIVEQAIGLQATSFRPAGLAAGQTYHWRLRGRAGDVTSPWSLPRTLRTGAGTTDPARPVIYQLVVRHFGNTTGQNLPGGDLQTGGCGKFADIGATALRRLADAGITHVWLTGVLQQATLTDHSAYGQPPDDPDIVKGRAGSFFAITDYYDVCPDYAVDPARRLQEFQALVGRVHQAGLKVLIDFVPNHVARSYGSDRRPAGEPALGAADVQTAFFSRDNAFFYLQQNPGQGLTLTAPGYWNPLGLDRAFGPEDGTTGHVPRVTGNEDTSYSPAVTSWYETVKLNWGFDFSNHSPGYVPDYGTPGNRPTTWARMERIVEHWLDQGVDGFRCDFAHLVPAEAWTELIADARAHALASGRQLLFIAEAYANQPALLTAGFDAVYDDDTYDTLKSVYQGTKTPADVRAQLLTYTDQDRAHWLRYLENHDERRIASPLVRGVGPDDSGFGLAEAGRHLGPLVYLAGNGPILLYNGQEVGETGAGVEGFGREDGRTTIFDYWRVPALSAWVNGHRYDGGQLTTGQLDLRASYRRMLTLANHPYARGNRYYGLGTQGGALQNAVAFCRYSTNGGGLLVCVTNLALTELRAGVQIPLDVGAARNAGLPDALTVRRLLSPWGQDDPATESTTRQALAQAGFSVTLPAGTSAVYVVEGS